MNKIIVALMGLVLLFGSFAAQAESKKNPAEVQLSNAVQEVSAASLDEGSKPKKAKKVRKAKKNKKAKKTI